MAISYHAKQAGAVAVYGLSSDTKPTTAECPNGATFYEEDTAKTYQLQSGVWVEILSPSYSAITSVIGVAVSSTLGNTLNQSYKILVGAGVNLTMPTAIGNKSLYTIKNNATSSVLVSATGGQTIDGDPTILLNTQYTSVDLISNSSIWSIT